jgi:predicted enzyme related to lactoylglutathione lyase
MQKRIGYLLQKLTCPLFILLVVGLFLPVWPASGKIVYETIKEAHMEQSHKARAVGINHVALVVGDIEEALDFYAQIFELKLRGRGDGMAFIDLGDQFIALAEGPQGEADSKRHFGLVVDSKEKVQNRLDAAGVAIIPGFGLNFLDPWGNRFQIVEYGGIQFSKTAYVLRGMGIDDLKKSADAIQQLIDKGMAPD